MNKIKSRHIWILINLVMLLFTLTHGQSTPRINIVSRTQLSFGNTKILEQRVYDNGFRHYDPIVPMFTQQDPMAEK